MNSVGNDSPPEYTFWIQYLDDKEANSFVPNVMIFLIWAIWFLNEFFCLIILLNFLIAIISQSYDSVMMTAV